MINQPNSGVKRLRHIDHINDIFDEITKCQNNIIQRRELKMIKDIIKRIYQSRKKIQTAREFYLLIDYKNADGSVPLAELTNTLRNKCNVELTEIELNLIGKIYGRRLNNELDGCITYQGLINFFNPNTNPKVSTYSNSLALLITKSI